MFGVPCGMLSNRRRPLTGVCELGSSGTLERATERRRFPRRSINSQIYSVQGVAKSRIGLWFMRTGKISWFQCWRTCDFVVLSLSILRFALDGAGDDLSMLGEMSLFASANDGGSKMRKSIVNLCDSLHPGLFAYLISLGLNRNQAEDIVHDSFLKLIQHLMNKDDQDDLRSWVFVDRYLRGRRTTISRKTLRWSLPPAGRHHARMVVVMGENRGRLRLGIGAIFGEPTP
jgi:hypothetical protein